MTLEESGISSAACSALGVVRKVTPGQVTIELAPPQPCAGCSGACLWYRVPQREQLTLAASGSIPVGAAVTVTLPDRYLLAGALLLYGLPLAALLAGAVAAATMLGTDLAAAAGAALGVSAALLASAPLRARLERATLRHLAVRPV